MLMADFIEQNKAAFDRMAAVGVVHPIILVYYERYKWHNEHGRSSRKTAANFGCSVSNITYGNMRMEERIVASNLN